METATAKASAKPHNGSPKKPTRTGHDTIVLTTSVVNSWLSPPFQRQVKENHKVKDLAQELKLNGGVITGVITLGNLEGKTYLIDGQHRRAAFLLSAIPEGYADIRILYCESMAQMAKEFVKLNSQLARMNPDDFLRGLEESTPVLGLIRQKCPFLGYDSVRRTPQSPMLSMAVCLRVWKGSESETPQHFGLSPVDLANSITTDDAQQLCEFLNLCYEAFGRDPEAKKLWSALNMLMCMWLYRRLVLTQYSAKVAHIDKATFRKCLQSISASGPYSDWLVGRTIGERDRSPCYGRLKQILIKRIFEETGKRVLLPRPPWDNSSGASKVLRV